MNMIKFLTELKDSEISEAGGKGYSLAVLINNGFNVPQGFVITSEAFFEYLRHNNILSGIEKFILDINKDNYKDKSREIKNLILSGKISEEIATAIKESLNKLNIQYVAIRSSAVSEDSIKTSFAGLHDTLLNIKSDPDIVLKNVMKCWASLFNDRALIYRIKKKIPLLEGIAIVIQEMIPAEISGIIFTVHPTDKKCLLIEACYGIGDMIVSGRVEPDDYTVDRETLRIIKKKIGSKKKMSTVENYGGISIFNTKKELAEKKVLSEIKIKEVIKTSLKVEKVFNCAQDIEWCIFNDTLWLLQSRPITGMLK